MDSCPNAEVTHTLNIRSDAFILACAFLAVLDGNLRETDTNGTNVTTQNVSAVQSLASAYGIIETLEVDCRNVREVRIALCVRLTEATILMGEYSS